MHWLLDATFFHNCNYHSYCNGTFRKNVAVLFVVCKGLETREGYDTTLSMIKQMENITMTDKSKVTELNFLKTKISE